MSQPAGNPTDPFTRFWMDMTSKFMVPGSPGAAPSPTVPSGAEEMLKPMRQAFFDAWAKYCEEFLGSDAFLDMLRRSMDNALAFRQQVNELLNKSLHDGQMPSREDTDAIMLVLRSMEERVLERLDKLARRVEALEVLRGSEPATTAGGEGRRKPRDMSR